MNGVDAWVMGRGSVPLRPSAREDVALSRRGLLYAEEICETLIYDRGVMHKLIKNKF